MSASVLGKDLPEAVTFPIPIQKDFYLDMHFSTVNLNTKQHLKTFFALKTTLKLTQNLL